ncbi:MAG: glycosyl hydrolase family 2, partial [Daejeonella sp.]|nr:glycosyl hydrolase family 2 [Daejeonella sp.]
GKNLIAVKVTRDYVTNIKDADKVTDVAVTVPVTNKMLKDLAHGFYGDDPAGIWQPVSLIISDPVRIEDVFIKPSLTGATFEVTVKNYSNAQSDFSISTTILGEKLKDKLYDNLSLKSVILKAGEERILVYSISDIKPRLWTPATPELYDFAFVLTDSGKETDRKTITSGFRTFEAKGDFLYLNGKQYWLRGGNQTPMSLAPNDTLLANKFTKLLHDGNIMITRTHTAPYNELWMTASDKNGVGVSYEGQWPWLMIKSSMPDQKLIDLWKQEFFDLMMKYRNHPALLFWTVNNEMKFYDNDPDFERAKLKMAIISDVVKMMRKIDPTRPVCFDSNYTRDEKKFGKDFFNKIDDGDIDDHHWYVNWYHGTIFSEFKGEWQKSFKNPGRPLISQEFSTGYPSETGHPTRFYTYVHQNPGTLVGNYAYEYANPEYFLKAQSFITREGAEAIRRTNEKAAGILHFAALTWFKNVYQADKIAPHLTYLQIKKALQPVLVSAEIWGRHFYAGEKLPTRIYVVNDQDNGNALAQTELQWSLQTADGKVLTSGKDVIPPVEYYGRKFIEPTIVIPQNLPTSRVDGKLVLKLLENGKVISENDYEVLLASKQWLNVASLNKKKIVLVDLGKKIAPVFNYQGVKFIASATVNAAVNQKPDVLVLAGLDSLNTSKTAAEEIKAFVHKGGKVLVLNSDKFSASLYPDYIKGVLKENGEIISMEIPESGVFDGIEPLDIRYFNNNQRENPLVSKAFFQVNQGSGIESLATFSKVHGYLEGDIYQRKKKLEGEWKGFPIVKITDKGSITLSEVLVEKGKTDPIAGKLLTNMIQDLIK